MPEWSEGYIDAGGLKLHYYRTGGNKPPVVFNHGAGDDGLCWTHVAKALEGRYDVIMPDPRGHGKSSSGNGSYSAALRVADLICLIQQLKLDRPIIGGHSMGAGTSLSLAAAHPELTRGIFLEDPPVFLPGETLIMGGKAVNPDRLGKRMIMAMRMFKLIPSFVAIPLWKKASPTYPDDEIIPMANAQKRVSSDFIDSMSAITKDIAAPVELFGLVPLPVLLIIGDKQKTSIVSQEAGQQAMQLNPQVRLVHLEGAGHNIRRDRFDGYLTALQDFLKEMYTTQNIGRPSGR